jgi:hypothetical protein
MCFLTTGLLQLLSLADAWARTPGPLPAPLRPGKRDPEEGQVQGSDALTIPAAQPHGSAWNSGTGLGACAQHWRTVLMGQTSRRRERERERERERGREFNSSS